MSSDVVGEIESIKEKIVSLSEAYLTSGRPYLLSRLGKDLGDDLRKLKAIADRPLAQIVAKELGDRYAIVLTGHHNNIQALVRSADAEPHQTASAGLVAHPKSEARFNYRFWAAFSVPVRSGRRFLDLRDLTFQELESPPQGEFVEIDASFVAPEDAPGRDVIIKDNIDRWLKIKGYSREQFMAQPRAPEGVRPSSMAGGRSILEAMIEALDRRQLASTSMTLDVVAELLRRRA